MTDHEAIGVLEHLWNWGKLSRFSPVTSFDGHGGVWVSVAPCPCATAVIAVDFPFGLGFYSKVERMLLEELRRCKENCTCHGRDLFYVPAGTIRDIAPAMHEADEAA